MAAQRSGSAAAVLHSEAKIKVTPINGFIGAEIEGVDLRHPLSPAQFNIVHDTFVNYEVIVMRDQDITVDQQMAFGALFGELSIHPFSPNLPDKPEVIILDYSADNPPDLTDKAVERRYTVLAFAAAEQSGSMHVPCGEVS